MSNINREKVLEILNARNEQYPDEFNYPDSFETGWHEAIEEIIDDIENLPEPKQGTWLPCNDENKMRCSECDTICLIAVYPHGKAAFCPICGTPMKI